MNDDHDGQSLIAQLGKAKQTQVLHLLLTDRHRHQFLVVLKLVLLVCRCAVFVLVRTKAAKSSQSVDMFFKVFDSVVLLFYILILETRHILHLFNAVRVEKGVTDHARWAGSVVYVHFVLSLDAEEEEYDGGGHYDYAGEHHAALALV